MDTPPAFLPPMALPGPTILGDPNLAAADIPLPSCRPRRPRPLILHPVTATSTTTTVRFPPSHPYYHSMYAVPLNTIPHRNTSNNNNINHSTAACTSSSHQVSISIPSSPGNRAFRMRRHRPRTTHTAPAPPPPHGSPADWLAARAPLHLILLHPSDSHPVVKPNHPTTLEAHPQHTHQAAQPEHPSSPLAVHHPEDSDPHPSTHETPSDVYPHAIQHLVCHQQQQIHDLLVQLHHNQHTQHPQPTRPSTRTNPSTALHQQCMDANRPGHRDDHRNDTNSPPLPAAATPPPNLNSQSSAYSVDHMFTMSSTDQWLYRPPPPYCPIPTAQPDDYISVLLNRIGYLGPLARVKILNALESAKVHETPALLAQNLTVAAIVADLQMDVDTVCAAILIGLPHDFAHIEHILGEDVASILQLHAEIRRVLDITNDTVFSETDYASLRELILVCALDHRAISLELASAVVSTRALDSLSADQEKRTCARRAMNLYAPLANQLGIWVIQSELEELAFMYLNPQAFHTIQAELAHRMRESQRILADMKARLERALSPSRAVRDAVRSVQIKGRVKSSYSCYRKIVRKGTSLSDIYDLLALRIIVRAGGVDEEAQARACYAVADVVKECLPVISSRSKDYVANPKSNGYRSLHMTVAPTEDAPVPLEIQIRTERMHYVAEFGAAAHWVYKLENLGETTVPLVFVGPNMSRHLASETCENRVESISPATAVLIEDELEVDTSLGDAGGLLEKDQATEDDDIEPRGGYGRNLCAEDADDASHASVDEKFVAEWSARESEFEFARSLVKKGLLGEAQFLSMCRGGLTVGSTLRDLACKMGMASRGMIALVNGTPMPMSHRLRMSDSVRWL